jgi:hypothetical protein
MSLTLLQKRFGVSEIVASLVLLLIVSSLGVFLYTVTTSTTNTQIDIARTEANREIQRALERFRIVAASKENDNYTIAVLNYGDIDITISDIYINGEILTSPSEDLQSLELKLIYFEYTSATNSTLMITIVSDRGISHSYSYNSAVT